MAIERDCNTCRFHLQGRWGGSPICRICVGDDRLPYWQPQTELGEYVEAINERHPEEAEYTFPNHPINPYQSRKESLIEATLNTLSGFLVSFGLWLFVVSPLFGIQSNPVESFWITCLFTVVSVARSYVWRRLFVNKFFWRKV